jgi:peptidyl-prolyl cis-trans isomerase SurA
MDMSWRRWAMYLFFSFLMGAVVHLASSRAEVVDRIIAVVNDDVITLSELQQRTNAFVAARQQNPFLDEQEESLDTIRMNILNALINERLAAQEISRLDISVSEADVDEAVERIKEENLLTQEAFEAELRKQGMEITDLRQQIRDSLEQSKLVNREVRSKTVITEEMVESYYRSHLEEFQSKERWRIQDIFLPFSPSDTTEQRDQMHKVAEYIIERLRQGDDFALLARRFSKGPGAESGGDLGYFSRGELEPALEAAVETLEAGEVSPDIETVRGIHIIKVMEVDKTPPRSLDEVRESIRHMLYKREVDFRYREWLSGLRERSYVKIVY